MTIVSIVILVFGIIVTIACIVVGVFFITQDVKGQGIVAFLVALIFGGAMIVGPIIYSNTEQGKRALKDQQSNFSAGIQREVKVYDVNGKLIEHYEGKFDVETDHDSYILFDDEEGKRHIIFYKTGQVIIDEK